ncbi:neprilysin-2 isoform X1 [Drosophila rhopaloa]|uniref:Membrane metallo-endopeptidase-like 1 n=1 Tax=Drosophila rhopaloa TaxID=1041015 RepID=A0ABM5J2K0_DRORH|nr:neprilysin-2 isoform X1 [Drosophila rhopaloa]XP_044313045.1 neprilysin-2 isoform X1 [Drosophila rhopaloa]XP_044313046.1 neprilysin-2 isoform X1 [Drosophila rhopaloa]XP_044313047.1 neprilysin-2 isoform X1 [Drosophila rhopaloa]XP_044313048.1 neprilysin-2 isoform X1 [Drosophila rhopaloa]
MQTVIKNPNWWRRRTKLERSLLVVSGILFVAAAAGFGLWINDALRAASSPENPQATALHGDSTTINKVPMGTATKGKSGGDSSDVCLTQECIHTASTVLRKMKPEVEPCDNFYEFACGSYLEEENIPDDKVSISTFSVISDKLQEQLKEIITAERPETDPKHFRLPNLLYKACMNKTLIETLGPEPITRVAEKLGGWPLIKGDSWNADDSWTWQEQVKKFRTAGFSMDYIIDFSIGVDLQNSTKRLIDLDQSSLALSREYLVKGFNETLVTAYYDYMVDIAVLFGANKDLAKTELLSALEFEIDLANISWPNEKRRNSSELYNLRTPAQLQAAYPYVQWVDYMNALLPEGLDVAEDEKINLSVPSFFEELGKLLARTPKRVIANYMFWRIHGFSVGFLNEEFRKRQLQYATSLSGRQEQEARWKECVDMVTGSNCRFEDDGIAISVGSLYVRKHFHKDSKANALEMVNDIRSVFNDILDEVNWMDPKTKKEAKEKLHSMATHIGYPDEMLDNEKLAAYYAKLDIDPDKYFESFLGMNIFGTDYSFNKLRLPVNKTDWVRHARPAIVNAFYSSLENSIQFPAGILQGHFFNAQRPKYMNFGAIGYVIGHEITHGFDDQGRQFDVKGNLRDWWQPDTQKAYLAKAKCIIEQYGNYTEKATGMNLNGINTQGENIADNGGVKESYIAYRRWAEKHGPEPKLPGLDYTPEQMFWLSSGQTWCAKYRKESLKMRITTGVHSPSEFRVLGSLSNMKDFAKDFQCPEGSPMNPVQKCEVW